MIREDRELLAELARMNSDVVKVAMRVMDDSAGTAEQREFGARLIALGEAMQVRAKQTAMGVVEGEVDQAVMIDVADNDGAPARDGADALPGRADAHTAENASASLIPNVGTAEE